MVNNRPTFDEDGGSGGVGRQLWSWALSPLWGGVQGLKWAGRTLHQAALGPAMGCVANTAKALTPQRTRDLARLLTSFTLNGVGLARTPETSALLVDGVRVLKSFLTMSSSPEGRQFVVEASTGLRKLWKVLGSKEAKACVQQGTIILARGMDALSSPHAKILLQVRDNQCRSSTRPCG